VGGEQCAICGRSGHGVRVWTIVPPGRDPARVVLCARHAEPLARVVASANTFGRGADRTYVGRQALDGATLDRFSVEYVEVDRTLEETLCLATGLDEAAVKKVLGYVRTLRRNANKHRMPVIISPRASVGMCRLIKAGRTVNAAIESRCRRGLSDADWQKLSGDAVPIHL